MHICVCETVLERLTMPDRKVCTFFPANVSITLAFLSLSVLFDDDERGGTCLTHHRLLPVLHFISSTR